MYRLWQHNARSSALPQRRDPLAACDFREHPALSLPNRDVDRAMIRHREPPICTRFDHSCLFGIATGMRVLIGRKPGAGCQARLN
jgi:hypothetical protein